MTAKYHALLTHRGAAKLANATALGRSWEITHMAVGDGGGTLPTPLPSQTQLLNERHRAAINSLTLDPSQANHVIAELIIPATAGGWWVREIGLLDKDGDLIAVANCAETYKPLRQEGSGRTQIIRMILIVSNTAAVTLKHDPAVVLVTRHYADKKMGSAAVIAISDHTRTLDPHPQYARCSQNLADLTDKSAARTHLQLGSAATKNVGHRRGDIMVVGAFGFGGDCIDVLSGIDALTKTGLYRTDEHTADIPAGFYSPTIQHIQHDAVTAHQIMFSTNNASSAAAKISYRLRINGYWKAWTDILTNSGDTLIPVGIPLPYPGITPPKGYLKCNGSSFSPIMYPILARRYPTHRLPDLRGEFIRGLDDGRWVDGGRTLLSAQTDALQNITGGISGVAESLGSAPESAFTGAFAKSPSVGNENTPRHTDWTACGSFHFDAARVVRTAAETRPRNLAFCYILKAN